MKTNSQLFSLADGLSELRQAISRWHLVADGQPFHTSSSVLQFVLAPGAQAMLPAVLKVALCAEERRAAKVLRWWQGKGAVRVRAFHENAVLLERACGSRSLAKMSRTGQDDAASRILCSAAAQLHARPYLPSEICLSELVPLAQWFTALISAESTNGGLFRETAAVARNLLAAPQEKVVLHGDLHHENILDAGERGWLAIDPKGLLGERGFDFANLFCNPDATTATAPGRLERQVNIVAEAAGLEHNRLLAWIAAWSGLSALWHVEDGESPAAALAVADKALRAFFP